MKYWECEDCGFLTAEEDEAHIHSKEEDHSMFWMFDDNHYWEPGSRTAERLLTGQGMG